LAQETNSQFGHSIFKIRFSTFQTITMNFEQRTTNNESRTTTR
jgi:hypothetical protein